MIVVSLLADMMNFPVDEIPTLIISLLCALQKSSASAAMNEGELESFLFVILKTRMVLSTDNDEMKALNHKKNLFRTLLTTDIIFLPLNT